MFGIAIVRRALKCRHRAGRVMAKSSNVLNSLEVRCLPEGFFFKF